MAPQLGIIRTMHQQQLLGAAPTDHPLLQGPRTQPSAFSRLPDKSLLKRPRYRYRSHNTVWDLVVHAGQLPNKSNLQLVNPARQGLLLF